jgi:uncharacterized protein (TIGR02145 family)
VWQLVNRTSQMNIPPYISRKNHNDAGKMAVMKFERTFVPKLMKSTFGHGTTLLAAAILPLLSCSDQATAPTAVLGGYASSIPVTATIVKDTARPQVDSVVATVRQSNRVHRVVAQAFAEGRVLGLDSVGLDAPFTVSLTGFVSTGGARIACWWAHGSDTLQYSDVASALSLVAVSGPRLDSLPHLDSMKVGVVFPATQGLWITSDSSDPRTSRTAKPITAALTLGKAQLYKFALRADSVPSIDKPSLWSDVKTLTLRQNTPVPQFSLAGGSYTRQKRLALSDSVSNAVVLWSTDSLHWNLFKDTIALDSSMKIYARAVGKGMDTSRLVVASYELKAAPVQLDLASGSFSKEQVVHISDSTVGVEFHCSSDSSTWSLCKDSVILSQTGKLHVYASRSGWTNSSVASAAYEFKLTAPSLSVASGSFTAEQAVTFGNAITGVQYRCSNDSVAWTDCDTAKITKSGSLHVYATKTGWTPSLVASASYSLSVLPPTFLTGSGVYDTTKVVGALATTPGSSIEVSRDSLVWVPMVSAVVVDKPTSLYIRALRTGWTTSPVNKATYGFSDTTPELTGLSFSGGTASTVFKPELDTIVDTLESAVTTLGITAVASAACDSVFVGDAFAPAGKLTISVPRDTSLTVRSVNLRNGKARSWVVKVFHRLPVLTRLAVDHGALVVPFAPTATSFTDSVSAGTATVNLTIAGEGVLRVDGSKVDSGTPVALATTKMHEIVDSSLTSGKKRTYFLYFATSTWNMDVKYASVSLSGRSYRTVVIGTQTWMAENLSDSGTGVKGLCYDSLRARCDTMGRYYAWADAMKGQVLGADVQTVQGVCPTGWHIPSRDEANLLVSSAGAWDALRAIQQWGTPGADANGFRLLPSGGLYPSASDWGTEGYFWTATEGAAGKAYAVQAKAGAIASVELSIGFAYPVRCVKN